jgi:hypothetical protein
MGRRCRRLLLSLLAFASLGSGDAAAYVREVTSTGVPIAWKNPCVTMHLFAGSPPPVLTTDSLVAAGMQATAAWSYPALDCTDIRLTTVVEPELEEDVGYDRKNVIVFRQDSWCRKPTPVDDAGMPDPYCYPASALALTSVFKNKKTGEILDADIEFNAVDYAWGDLVGQPSLATANTADFQNALTHELGHVVGLDHNCFTSNDLELRRNDNTGSPEVDCSLLPDAVAEATMYPSVLLTDTARRTLSVDDVQGACEIYPHVHAVCPPPPSGGCGVTSQSLPEHPWPELACVTMIAILIAGLVLWRARQEV